MTEALWQRSAQAVAVVGYASEIINAIRHNILAAGSALRRQPAADARRSRSPNTGPVVLADQTTRLLQPFQRLSATRSADDEGLGPGLSIVAAIAKAHRAALTINPGHKEASTSGSVPPGTATAEVGEEHSPERDKTILARPHWVWLHASVWRYGQL